MQAVAQGAHDAARGRVLRAQAVGDEVGYRGLAVGARDADHVQIPGRMIEEPVRHDARAHRQVRDTNLDGTVGAPLTARRTLADDGRRTGRDRGVDVVGTVGRLPPSRDEYGAWTDLTAVRREPAHGHVEIVGHGHHAIQQPREPPARGQGLGGHHCTTPSGSVAAGSALGA